MRRANRPPAPAPPEKRSRGPDPGAPADWITVPACLSPGRRPGRDAGGRCRGAASRLVGAPEPGERLAVRALAELLEGAVADLADPLARDAEQRADLLERPLLAVVQAVVEVEDLALALRQVLLEHPVEELAPGLRLDALLDVLAL